MSYRPEPIDTSGIKLDAELEQLIERLAATVHDRWARHRLREGWTYGPRRDDSQKQHPGLVPYDALPEAEKEYDRETAVGTVKAILALGFTIGPRREEGA